MDDMRGESDHKKNAIQEIHSTYNRSVMGLALQLFNALGVAIIMVVIYQAAEWKGGVDADRARFQDFISRGDRYPLDRGTRLETRVDTHIQENRLELKELRKEWLGEMKELRKMVEKARHDHGGNQ